MTAADKIAVAVERLSLIGEDSVRSDMARIDAKHSAMELAAVFVAAADAEAAWDNSLGSGFASFSEKMKALREHLARCAEAVLR